MNKSVILELKQLASNIVEGAPGAYTETMFYADFPQFKAEGSEGGFVPDEIMNVFLKMVNSTVTEARWGEAWRFAAGLFLAHYVTMYLRQMAGHKDGSKTAKNAADTGAILGIVSSASLGDASVSYDTSAATQGTQNWGQFNLTTYGQQYASMARLFTVGGSYVI